MFRQERVATNAGLFLEGLLGDEHRKTGWMRAEAAGDPGPWRQQAILGRRDWDADGLRDIVRDYVIEHLADDDAVLVIDETGFLKQGKASCGVARQYTGSAGKITNCQIGVSLPMFRATVTRSSIARCIFRRNGPTIQIAWKAAYVPSGVGFATKTTACDENDCARHRRFAVPFKWGCRRYCLRCWRYRKDSNYAGVGKGYVLGVSSAHVFSFLGQAAIRRRQGWRTLPGRGARPTGNACRQGPELRDRGCMIGAISNWPISRSKNLAAQIKVFGHAGLLIRRHITDGDLAFFTTWCPAATSIETLVAGSKAIGGRSRTVLRPRKTSSDSITTRSRSWAWVASPRFPGDARLRHR